MTHSYADGVPPGWMAQSIADLTAAVERSQHRAEALAAGMQPEINRQAERLRTHTSINNPACEEES